MRVLVTGGGGFVGKSLVPRLAQRGDDVWRVVRPGGEGQDAERGGTIELDLTAPLDTGLLPPVDAVVHLAQANVRFPVAGLELYRVNVVSTLELLQWATRSGVRRFVLASSGDVYGRGAASFAEDAALAPAGFYALTKQHAEQLVEAHGELIETIVLRLFAPYGPLQARRLVPSLIERVRTGTPVALQGAAGFRINPIYVTDAVEAIIRSLDVAGSTVVNVAGDEVVDIRTLAELIGDLLGVEAAFEHEPPGAGDLVGENRRMHETLGLGALVPLAEGLRRTIDAEAAA